MNFGCGYGGVFVACSQWSRCTEVVSQWHQTPSQWFWSDPVCRGCGCVCWWCSECQQQYQYGRCDDRTSTELTEP